MTRSVGPAAAAAQQDAAKHELWERNYGRRAAEDVVSYFSELQSLLHLRRPCERRPHQRNLQYARPKPQLQRNATEHDGGHHQGRVQDNPARTVRPNSERGATESSYARILGVEGVGIPRHARAAHKSVQKAAAAAIATSAGVSPGEHDGTICDAKPDDTTVYGAADDDARAHTDVYDAVAANAAAAYDGAATADDGTNGTIISNGTAATTKA